MDSLNPNKDYNPFTTKQKNNKYTQEQLDYIHELVTLGWSASRISQTFNLGRSGTQSIKKRIKDDNWVTNGNRNSSLSNEEIKDLHQDVLDGKLSHEEIAHKYHISISSLERRIVNNKWENKPKKCKYSFNEHYFDIIDDEHKAYWLGFLYADGYILSKRNRKAYETNEQQSFGFSISMQDSELFDKFKEDLESNHPINIYEAGTKSYKNSQPYGRILLTSQHVVNSLKKYGLVENKTFITQAPPISSEFYYAFIRGYSDGDGSVYINKNGKFGWSLVGTYELLSFIKNTLGKPELKLSQRWPERYNNNWSLVFTGNSQVPSLLNKIYSGATIYLERKYNKYAEMQGING